MFEDRLVNLEYGSDLGNIKSLSFDYDKFKRINTITANTTSGSGKLREYTYDQRGRVDTIRDYTDFKDSGLSLSHKWKECKFSYDNLDRQTELKYTDSENGNKVMESYKLSYDKNSHITKEQIHNDYPSEKSSIVTKNMDVIDEEDSNVQEGEDGTTVEQDNETTPSDDEAGSVSGKQNEIRSYTYDGLGQLTKVEIEDTLSGSTSEKNYTYDILGNRTKEVEEGETRSYDYNSLNQLISSVTSTEEKQDESGEEGTEGSTINGITSDMLYTYDKAGNQTKVSDSISGDITEMSYDPAARLSKAVIKNGDKTKLVQTNLYNGNGQRVEKAEQIGTDIDTNNYFYQGDSVLYTKSNHEFVDENKAIKNVNSSAFNLLGQEGNIIATERDGSNNTKDYYFYNKDARGSTTNLLDNKMESLASYKYDDFGNTETYAGENGYVDNEICYTGGIYDDTTQLYYLNARYYNPEDGNFISQDSYRGEKEEQGTWNLYDYCSNDPINKTDPTGHWGSGIHYDLTKRWGISSGLSGSEAEELASADKSIDSGNTNPKTTDQWALGWHFNRKITLGGSQDTRMKHFNKQFKNAKKSWKKNKGKALRQLGRGLHLLQDIYAHKDWAVSKKNVLPHSAYIKVGGRWFQNWLVFDNPNYAITKNKKSGRYHAYYKGSYGSTRYQKTKNITKAKVKKFLKEVK